MGKENPLTPDAHTEVLPSLTSQVGLPVWSSYPRERLEG